MLEFARWKYALIVVVLLMGTLFALPNVFGDDQALQVERKNRAPMDDFARQSIEDLLHKQQISIKRDYVDDGRLILAFSDVASQLKARDTVEATMSDVYRSALGYASRAPAWVRKLGLKAMPLGLDLRGGLYLLYQVDLGGAVSQMIDSYEQSFRRALNEAKLPFTDITATTSGNNSSTDAGPDGLLVTLPQGADVGAVQAALRKVDSSLTLTTDSTASGPVVRMVLTPAQIKARQDYALDQSRTTLSNRVNELGVSESIVQRQGLSRINVQLPGVQNSAEVKDLLGKVATLEFRLEDTQNSAAQAQQSGHAPLGTKLYDYKGSPVLLKREVIVTGDQLTSATSSAGQEGPEVSIKLDSRGADAMFRVTRLNIGKPMAVVFIEKSRKQIEVNGQKVDKDTTSEKVINIATIQGVFSSQFRITGLGAAEARDLSLLLRSGSLPAPVEVVAENTIGPSLGKDNIAKGVLALEIGMLAVFIFMALYYHAFGLVADAVLVANVILLTALLSMMHASLSLPGIAGIILTVGIAVDANVLIYERIREELRNGVSPQAAIRAGFDKAFSAIADSNVTALIAGLALWVIGTGAVRNFAVVLTLGIVTSMFTSLLGSRALVTLMYGGGRRKIESLSIG
jgi:preprotein translocase subunit SecD